MPAGPDSEGCCVDFTGRLLGLRRGVGGRSQITLLCFNEAMISARCIPCGIWKTYWPSCSRVGKHLQMSFSRLSDDAHADGPRRRCINNSALRSAAGADHTGDDEPQVAADELIIALYQVLLPSSAHTNEPQLPLVPPEPVCISMQVRAKPDVHLKPPACNLGSCCEDRHLIDQWFAANLLSFSPSSLTNP